MGQLRNYKLHTREVLSGQEAFWWLRWARSKIKGCGGDQGWIPKCCLQGRAENYLLPQQWVATSPLLALWLPSVRSFPIYTSLLFCPYKEWPSSLAEVTFAPLLIQRFLHPSPPTLFFFFQITKPPNLKPDCAVLNTDSEGVGHTSLGSFHSWWSFN